MASAAGHVIGLRVDPDVDGAEWFTIWFEDPQGVNKVAAHDGRARWAGSVDGALDLAKTFLAPECAVADGDIGAICDVAATLHAVASGETGEEATVLLCLNLLDDVLITIDQRSSLPDGKVLDRLVVALTEGQSLPSAVELVGGKQAVIEALLAGLGRLFALSSFHCEIR